MEKKTTWEDMVEGSKGAKKRVPIPLAREERLLTIPSTFIKEDGTAKKLFKDKESNYFIEELGGKMEVSIPERIRNTDGTIRSTKTDNDYNKISYKKSR